MPAKTSSAITPQPFGKVSILRMPRGLTMSKNLNNTRALSIYNHSAGKNKRLIIIPATSSITTLLLSLPQIASTTFPDHTPRKQINRVIKPASKYYRQALKTRSCTMLLPPACPLPCPRNLFQKRWLLTCETSS